MSWPQRKLGEIMPKKTGSINPAEYENETFELYSIPSFDVSQPEIIKGAEIGSSKKLVQPGDVLLSKIVPHIRRCWIVPETNGLRQIASGEWIIFRSSDVNQKFLKYFLISDVFHSKFMTTISGVGGSLMRARPSEVEKIDYPLPPLPIQKQIATVLEKADTLRSQCQQMERELNSLAQSVFLYSVGDKSIEFLNWPLHSIESLCSTEKGSMRTGPFGSDLKHSEFVESGYPVIGIDNAVDNEFKWKERRFITEEKFQKLKRYTVKSKDIIITIMGTVGRVAVIPDNIPTSISTKHLAVLTINEKIALPEFVADAFKYSTLVNRQISKKNKGAIMDGLNLGVIKSLNVRLPPLQLQNEYLSCKEKLISSLSICRSEADELTDSFNSLMQRAFKGVLELKDVA